MNSVLKVIIRKEYNKYTKKWGYLAAFPEIPANPGRILCLPFHIAENGKAVFEPHDEADLSYYYRKKLVHANTEEAEKCCAAIDEYYNDGSEEVRIKLIEKIPHNRG